MISKEQKIKMILDIRKGKISNKIIQLNNDVVWTQPVKCTINDIQFEKNEYEKTIDYLKSLNIQILEFVSVSKQFPDE